MIELWRMPCRAQELIEGPSGVIRGGALRLTYDYETAAGHFEREALTFTGVIAVSFTEHESCAEDQVEAYNRVVIVPASRWAASIDATRIIPLGEVHHMRAYFEGVGCYDVLATELVAPHDSERYARPAGADQA
jgi:hypothetical protein